MAHEGARFAFAASARNGPFTSALRQGKALIEPRLDPACLVEGAIGTSTIVAFWAATGITVKKKAASKACCSRTNIPIQSKVAQPCRQKHAHC